MQCYYLRNEWFSTWCKTERAAWGFAVYVGLSRGRITSTLFLPRLVGFWVGAVIGNDIQQFNVVLFIVIYVTSIIFI